MLLLSAVAGGQGGGWKFWKKLSFFVAFAAVGLGMVNAYLAHQEHAHDKQPEYALRVYEGVHKALQVG